MTAVRVLFAACMLCAAVPGDAAAQEYPTHTVRRATGRIVIDGVLDEADWVAARSFGDFVFPWYTEGEREQTEVKMLWDDTFLYVAFACDDAHIWAEHFNTNSSVSRDDCAELFWNPYPEKSLSFYQFEINCVGNILSRYYRYEEGRQSPRFPTRRWSRSPPRTLRGATTSTRAPARRSTRCSTRRPARHGPTKAATPAASPRATRSRYAGSRSRRRSSGFERKPVSTRIAGTAAQLKPVRSERSTTPSSRAPVARTSARWTRRAARRLGR